MITVSRLTTADEQGLSALNDLLQQLRSDPASHVSVTMELLNVVLGAENACVLVVKDGGKIIGTGTIIWNQILTDRFAFIEDVVVDGAYRGQGLGEKLMLELIATARANKIETVGLTSRPSRVAANSLYQKLGFKQKETNYYEMGL